MAVSSLSPTLEAMDEKTWARDGSRAAVANRLAARGEPADGREVARQAAARIAAAYGTRLRRVILFGSFARGDANTDSDVDLLVVLDRVDDYEVELDRLSDLTFEHLLRSQRIVEAFPVGEEEFARGDRAFLASARLEGVQIG